MSQPFRDAGFIVMMPVLRSENGQPGDYSMFYDEVDDVLAAADVLARQPDVDAQRIYSQGTARVARSRCSRRWPRTGFAPWPRSPARPTSRASSTESSLVDVSRLIADSDWRGPSKLAGAQLVLDTNILIPSAIAT